MIEPGTKDELERLLHEKEQLVNETIRDSLERLRESNSEEDRRWARENIYTTLQDLKRFYEDLSFYEFQRTAKPHS